MPTVSRAPAASRTSPSASLAPPAREEDPQAALGNAAAQDALRANPPTDDGDSALLHEETPTPMRDGTRPETPTTKAAALARHSRNLGMMNRLVKSALSVDVDPSRGFNSRPNLLHNAAEWIDAGEADMYVLTPVHDSHLRPAVPAGQNAYFDNRKPWTDASADYNAALDASGKATDPAGLTVEFATVDGEMSDDGRTLLILDPMTHGESEVVDVMIHEVQHDADQHRNFDPWSDAQPAAAVGALDTASAGVINAYKTEFRAYWIENPEGSAADALGDSSDTAVTNRTFTAVDAGPDGTLGTADDASSTVTTAFKNARQASIFERMFSARTNGDFWDPTANGGSGDWSSAYAYVAHYYAMDPAFQAMVDGYDRPVGGNLIDSIRIQALSTALASGDTKAIDDAIDGLDALDLVYLADKSQSQPLWDQATAMLSAIDLAMFEASVGGQVGPNPAETVKVQKGDTLSSLAQRYLGDIARWHEIYDANKKAIGADPNKLEIGTKLVLPVM